MKITLTGYASQINSNRDRVPAEMEFSKSPDGKEFVIQVGINCYAIQMNELASIAALFIVGQKKP